MLMLHHLDPVSSHRDTYSRIISGTTVGWENRVLLIGIECRQSKDLIVIEQQEALESEFFQCTGYDTYALADLSP